MRYVSTRGRMSAQTFSEVLLGGLAPDGGLAIPEVYPYVSARELAQWRGLSYPELAFEILRLFADDLPAADLRTMIERASRGVDGEHGHARSGLCAFHNTEGRAAIFVRPHEIRILPGAVADVLPREQLVLSRRHAVHVEPA